jgi:hypothetical protein
MIKIYRTIHFIADMNSHSNAFVMCYPGSWSNRIITFYFAFVSPKESLKSFIFACKLLAASELYCANFESTSDYCLYFFSISPTEYNPADVFIFFLNYLISIFSYPSPYSYLSLSTSIENCSYLSTAPSGSCLKALS